MCPSAPPFSVWVVVKIQAKSERSKESSERPQTAYLKGSSSPLRCIKPVDYITIETVYGKGVFVLGPMKLRLYQPLAFYPLPSSWLFVRFECNPLLTSVLLYSQWQQEQGQQGGSRSYYKLDLCVSGINWTFKGNMRCVNGNKFRPFPVRYFNETERNFDLDLLQIKQMILNEN